MLTEKASSPAPSHRFGISQLNTLNRIEADKKKLDWRRSAREIPHDEYRSKDRVTRIGREELSPVSPQQIL